MTAKDYRAIAWGKVKANLVPAILAGLIALYLGGLLVASNPSFSFTWEGKTYTLPNLMMWPINLLRLATILGLVQFVIGGVIRLGYCEFLLKQHDEKNPEIQDLFLWFGSFGKGFVLYLLEGLYIVLWTLCLIIPGIVASYRYAMAPFILAENPDMTPSEAIDASKEMMDGHKWELFCLDFSFIGWIILNGFTLGLGSIVLNPYMNSARTAFYRELKPAARDTIVDAPDYEISNDSYVPQLPDAEEDAMNELLEMENEIAGIRPNDDDDEYIPGAEKLS